jgi:hypothetical protein
MGVVIFAAALYFVGGWNLYWYRRNEYPGRPGRPIGSARYSALAAGIVGPVAATIILVAAFA